MVACGLPPSLLLRGEMTRLLYPSPLASRSTAVYSALGLGVQGRCIIDTHN